MNDKRSSWAVIHDLDNDRQDMVGVGSVVAGARVVSIERDKVVLSLNGREEILVLGAEGPRSASGPGEQAPKESAASTYVVDRKTVRENLDNMPTLLTQARAEVYFKEGRPEGFQLSQIQQGSILKSVGFQDGDVIRSVNAARSVPWKMPLPSTSSSGTAILTPSEFCGAKSPEPSM